MPFAKVLRLRECSGRPFHMVDLNVTRSGELFMEEFYVWTTNIGKSSICLERLYANISFGVKTKVYLN